MGSPRANPADTAGIWSVLEAMESLHLSPFMASFRIFFFAPRVDLLLEAKETEGGKMSLLYIFMFVVQ